MRLDLSLVSRYGYTRNKAQSHIRSGLVRVGGSIITKPSTEILDPESITIEEAKELHWVARSAGKLDAFLDSIDYHPPSGGIALDIGSSTGGFCQVWLARGVTQIVAVDVGRDQLHESLRSDSRIELHEMTDIRAYDDDRRYDMISIDVSFVSIREIIRDLDRQVKDTTDIFALWKPQFEVGREHLRRTGVPRDLQRVARELRHFVEWCESLGYEIRRVSPAAVIGEAGNQEYMISLRRRA